MNLPAAIALIATVIGVAVAALSFTVGSSRRWAHYRLLSITAAAASLYGAAEITLALPFSAATIVTAMRFQGTAGVIHILSWQLYGDRHLQQTPGWAERIARGGLLALAPVWLIPGAMLDGTTTSFDVEFLHARYTYPEVTPLGTLSFAVELGFLVLILGRYARSWARVHGAAVHTIALSTIVATAASDVFVALHLYRAPFTISLGFVASVGVVGGALAHAFVRYATGLDAMKERLEQLIEARTAELVDAESALMRAEKLAALGQLSAGVAHEINNPAAAVGANIEYLRQELAAETIPDDALECLDDSLDAVGRISKIVRQLLDVGRSATSTPLRGAAAKLDRAVQHAVATARATAGGQVRIVADIPEDLSVRADESALVQVLLNLVVNAVQAIPKARADGEVSVRAERGGEVVRVTVTDNGTGMSEETKRRLFEPFYTTKPVGQGTGLGLSVCLALVRSFGGDLTVRSRPGETTMQVELPWAMAPEDRLPTRRAELPARRQSLLLVEDDDRVRRALARTLASAFDLEVVPGVEAALALLEQRTFDVVLSDWKMPEGGGERLLLEVAERWPELVRSIFFITGGKLTTEEQALLTKHRSHVLKKPFAIEALLEALAEAGLAGAPNAAWCALPAGRPRATAAASSVK